MILPNAPKSPLRVPALSLLLTVPLRMIRLLKAPVMPVTVKPETRSVKVPETPVILVAENPLVVKLIELILVALTVVPVIVTPLKVPLTVALPEV